MDLSALQQAAELGGALLAGPTPAQELVLVERPVAHGLPEVLLLGHRPEDLTLPLAALAEAQARGLALNLCAVLPCATTDWPLALGHHRRRIGSLVAALDVGLPWLEDRPMMTKRLPGRLRAPTPLPLPPAPLRPLERQELRTFLAGWTEARFEDTFLTPSWRERPAGWEVPLWPDVALPEGSDPLESPLTLPSATPLTEALRGALRATFGAPVPWLPHPGDPAPLRGLLALTPAVAVFRGPEAAWRRAFEALATLPAPPHFCARC